LLLRVRLGNLFNKEVKKRLAGNRPVKKETPIQAIQGGREE
jgi:hypothetical protein